MDNEISKSRQVKPNFKVKPWRSPKYIAWVSSLPCALTTPWENWKAAIYLIGTKALTGFKGLSDPHHEPPPGTKGLSTKVGDEHCVPIRHDLHVKMESPGNSRKAVWEMYGRDPEEVKRRLHAAWKMLTGENPGNER